MKKNYTILKAGENELGLNSIKIKEIAILNKNKKEVIIYLDILELSVLAINDIKKIKLLLSKLDDDLTIDINIEEILNSNNYEKKEIVEFFLEYLKLENLFLNKIINSFEVEILDGKINIDIHLIFNMDSETKGLVYRNIKKKLKKYFNINDEIELSFVMEKSDNLSVKKEEVEIRNINFNFGSVKKNAIEKTKPSYKSKLDLISLDDINDDLLEQRVATFGEVFHIDLRELKNGNVIITIYITNDRNSLICSRYAESIEDVKVKLGDFVEVVGKYSINQYTQEPTLSITKLDVVEKEKKVKEDLSEVKRIELSAHTNMSEMISTIDSKSLIKRAKEFNHKAIAVTDYGVVHAFPFLAKEVKDDEDFKIIYGIEAYMVDDLAPLVFNAKDVRIEDEEFVVFDIESTGFSSVTDKIIEIGAIKIKNSKIIDTFSMFVNPEMIIPKKIVELTGINDNMVKDAETIDKVLPKFIEFFKNSTLVAHNAKFDVGFISKKIEQLNLKADISYIDTLEWAKVLIPDISRYSLDALTKRYNINLENHHRAIDDAKATAELFKIFLSNMLDYSVITLKDINNKVQKSPVNADTENISILVKNLKGLKRLYELVSISHLKYYGDKKPRILKSDLEKDRENLLISSSPIYAGRYNKGKLVDLYVRGMNRNEIMENMDFFDYIQIYPKGIYNDAISTEEISNFDFIEKMNKDFVEMAKEKNKIVVATGNVYYLDEKEKLSKAALLLNSEKAYRTYDIDTSNYFRTTDEMLKEFSYLEDVENIVIYNTHKISDMIEKIKPIPDGDYKPIMEGSEDEVREMSYNKAFELYGNPLPEQVKLRLDRELNSIIGNGFSVLYLIAQKLVKKSLDNGYLVGSRGSVGSSLVAYLMGITEVNSLYPHYRCSKCKYFEMKDFEGSGVDLEEKDCPKCNNRLIRDGHSIPFEVFMGFKGDKTPDIDLNFSGEYQGEIHKYTKELFGDDYVFRAGTISTLAEKNAYGVAKDYFEEKFTKEFEKNIFEKYSMTWKEINKLSKSKENTPEIEKIKSIKQLEEINFAKYLEKKLRDCRAEITRVSKKCEGARKTTGQHPGGMIVVPNYKSIYDFSPVQYPANDPKSGSIITHFDYHVMDQQLVKLDILGHDDPSTLRMLQDLTGVDVYNIPLTDEKVLSIFSSTKALGVSREDIGSELGTNGIPEFGTDFVKKMLEETRPKTFAELVRISGLSHGTDVWTNNAQDYVNQGIATLSEVITVRDDIMNHLIDMKMDNSEAFNIMEFVRKGLPSKNKEKWNEYKEKMKALNVKDWYIESCEKIKYMFPKGHAVAYVMMAVRIAYFKVYYPLEFYTAYLNRKYSEFKFLDMRGEIDELKINLSKLELDSTKSNDAKKKEKIMYEILIEMNSRGIKLLPIDIYKSEAKEFKIEDGKIRIPLIAMDKLGDVVAHTIVEERNKEEFSSIEDLIKRSKMSKTVLEKLREFGCIDVNLRESSQLTLF